MKKAERIIRLATKMTNLENAKAYANRSPRPLIVVNGDKVGTFLIVTFREASILEQAGLELAA